MRRQEKENKELKNKKPKSALSPYVTAINIRVNGLNTPIKADVGRVDFKT